VVDAPGSARLVIDRLVAAYNAKDLDGLLALYGPRPRYWSALGGWRDGRDEIAAHLRDLFARLPDERMTATTVVTDGATIVVEFTSAGTTPTGEPYQIAFTEVMTLDDGAITEVKVYIDPDDVPALG
jgi:uncharacterized protein (TIGR02246 family)